MPANKEWERDEARILVSFVRSCPSGCIDFPANNIKIDRLTVRKLVYSSSAVF